MAWIAPDVTRERPPRVADERAMLDGWLEWHRATLRWKCRGLGGEKLADRAVPPSTLSLLGLVRHMTEVERGWFRRGLAGEDAPYLYSREGAEDADFDEVDPARAEADVAAFEEECEIVRRIAAGMPLEATFTHRRHGVTSLRWVYVHMIEEYARHNGHADLLRERIDGAKGV